MKKYSIYILLLGSITLYLNAMEIPEEHTESTESNKQLKSNYTRADLYKAFAPQSRWREQDPLKFLETVFVSNPELANEVFPLKSLCNETEPPTYLTPLAASIHCNFQPIFYFLLKFCLPGTTKPLVNVNHIFNKSTEPNLAMLIAIRLQRYLMVKELIDHEGWVNIPQTYAGLFKISPLEIAQNLKIKDLLLLHGARKKNVQPLYTAEDLFKAIFPSGWEKPFDSTIDMETDRILEVKNILHTNPELACVVFQEINLTPLAATVRANLESLFKLLLAYRHPEKDEPIVDVNQIFGGKSHPNTALLEAIRLVRATMVIELVHHGAWVNIPEDCPHTFLLTPFQEALPSSDTILKFLLKNGAKPASPSNSISDLSEFIDKTRPTIPADSITTIKEMGLYTSPTPTPIQSPNTSPLAPRKSDEDIHKASQHHPDTSHASSKK